MKFKFVEHTADIGIEAYGENMKETFANAALGLFEIMIDTTKVEEKETIEITAKGEDIQSLLYDFLEQFLIIHDTDNLVFSRVVVNKLTDDFKIEATAYGEEFDTNKHEGRSGIKAITYQRMNITDKKIFYLVDI
ncbi:MAG: archease [Nanoarchaeota archaeon]|nr:archease [Nanoarchaeota archaeon]